MALTAEQKAIVTSCVPLLESHGVEVTKVFYDNLLSDVPSLQSVFSLSAQITDRQANALAGALHAYAANINDLSPILPVVERINQKHASLDISAPQYAIVGEYLLKALLQVLGRDVFTDQVEEAWGAAYWQLANLMIKREDTIMNNHESQLGGWKGWRQMRLSRKVVESSEITSFYWVPIDGGALPTFKPGQYISIRVDVPGGQQIRQYSLSDAPQPTNEPQQQYYRNSIKREEGNYPGLVSNILHNNVEEGDVVEMTNPAGDFFLDTSSPSDSPLILISAGVGLTPFLSFLNTLTSSSLSSSSESSTTRPITYIHTARNTTTHAFPTHIKSLSITHPSITPVTFHTRPLPTELKGRDYDFLGRLDLDALDANNTLRLDDSSAEYYICGPGKFMMGVAAWLGAKGVDDKRVKMEVFGAGNVEGRTGK